MVDVTINGLIGLRDNGNLTAGEVYRITDYPGGFYIYMTGKDSRHFTDDVRDSNARVLDFDLDTATITYMQDRRNFIEGNFDWTDNIVGNCTHVYLENAVNLVVDKSTGIYVEDTAEGIVKRCNTVTIGDGCTVDLDYCKFLDLGRDNTVVLDRVESVNIGDANDLEMEDNTGLGIGDHNSEITVTDGSHIIGSYNRSIILDGDSHIVGHDNIDHNIGGLCNEMSESKYITINGDFNEVEKTSLAVLDVSCGNRLDGAGVVTVQYTNNNEVQAADMNIDHKTPFVRFVRNGGVVRAEDLARRVNMQADSTGTVLLVDEEKFWQTSDTKANKHYVNIDGVWTNINE